jgi:prohead serine protease
MNRGAMIRKVLTDSIVLKADDVRGQATAIVNTTGIVDRQRDLMAVGSWGKVCREGQLPAVCLNHQIERLSVVGKVLRLEEWQPGDPRLPMAHRAKGAGALVADMQFALTTQAGRETFELVRGGYLKQWSVQFSISPDAEKQDRDVRTVKEVDELIEVSAVLIGASPHTALLAAKGQPMAVAFSELMEFARDRGESAGLHALTKWQLDQWEADDRAEAERTAASRKAAQEAREREDAEWLAPRTGFTLGRVVALRR